jgi:hypothetical protein
MLFIVPRIAIDRVAKDRPSYSGKHRHHGMNSQVIYASDGEILCVSGPLPGGVHDLIAARIWGIVRDLVAARLITLADKARSGAAKHVSTPRRGRGKPESQRRSTASAPGCAPGERANSQLNTWHILLKLRWYPCQAERMRMTRSDLLAHVHDQAGGHESDSGRCILREPKSLPGMIPESRSLTLTNIHKKLSRLSNMM